MFEGTDCLAGFYPVDEEVMDSFFVVRCPPTEEGDVLERVRRRFRPDDWICARVLEDARSETDRYEDTLVQIRMQSWSRGPVVLIGDACGCPTLIAGQGAHLAMGDAYVLARELERTDDVAAACRRYEQVLHAHTDSVQDGAARFARSFVPTVGTWTWLRRIAIRLALSRWLLRRTISGFGPIDVIRRYDHDG